MIRPLTVASLALLAACTWIQGDKTPVGPSPELIVSELLEISGADETLASWPALAKERVVAYNARLETAPLEPDQLEELEGRIGAVFDLARLRDELTAYMVEHLDGPSADATERFFRSAVGRGVRKREARIAEPEAIAGFSAYLDQLNQQGASRLRSELAFRLDRATHSSADATEFNLAIARALTQGLFAEGSPEVQPATLDAHAKQLRTSMEPLMRSQTVAVFMYAHEEAEIRELIQYVQFTESRSGRWFYGTLSDGLEQLLGSVERDLASEVRVIAAETTGGSPDEAAPEPAPDAPTPDEPAEGS